MEINAESLEAPKERLIAVDVTAQIGDRLDSEEEFEARDAARSQVVEEEKLSEIQERILAAIMAGDPEYLNATLTMRNPEHPDCAGSTFLKPISVSELVRQDWQPYEHPAVLKGCVAFKAPLAGTYGIVDLGDFHSSTKVKLVDPKGTAGTYGGGLLAEIPLASDKLPKVDFSVIILGPDDGKEVFFTVHPGEPMRPSSVDKEKWKGEEVSVHQAIERGFRYGKVKRLPAS